MNSSRNRANSDSDVLLSGLATQNTLTVDKTEVTIGEGDVIRVTWSIDDEVTSHDWIGLFIADDGSFKDVCIDQKQRGSNSYKTGSVDWHIDNCQHLLFERAHFIKIHIK